MRRLLEPRPGVAFLALAPACMNQIGSCRAQLEMNCCIAAWAYRTMPSVGSDGVAGSLVSCRDPRGRAPAGAAAASVREDQLMLRSPPSWPGSHRQALCGRPERARARAADGGSGGGGARAQHRDRRRRRRRAGARDPARRPARAPRAGAHHAGRLRADPRLEAAAARGRGRHAVGRDRRPRLLRACAAPSLRVRARPDERPRPGAPGDRARPGQRCERRRAGARGGGSATTRW